MNQIMYILKYIYIIFQLFEVCFCCKKRTFDSVSKIKLVWAYFLSNQPKFKTRKYNSSNELHHTIHMRLLMRKFLLLLAPQICKFGLLGTSLSMHSHLNLGLLQLVSALTFMRTLITTKYRHLFPMGKRPYKKMVNIWK